MTIVEIVTCKVPWSGSAMEVMRNVRDGRRPALPAGMDEKLRAMAQECWDQEQSRRPGFREVATRLAKLCAERGYKLPPEIQKR